MGKQTNAKLARSSAEPPKPPSHNKTRVFHGNFGAMVSYDLSTPFDLVYIKLLLKRLKVIGLPHDLIELMKV